jgi:hypothetical protein
VHLLLGLLRPHFGQVRDDVDHDDEHRNNRLGLVRPRSVTGRQLHAQRR